MLNHRFKLVVYLLFLFFGEELQVFCKLFKLCFEQFLVNLSDDFLARFLTRSLARFLTRSLARVLTRFFGGGGKTTNAVYSTTRP